MTRGERIKNYRENLGITQDELAQRINTTPQAIYKYEKGIVTNIPLDKIEKMSKIFNIRPAKLVGWEPCADSESQISVSSEQFLVNSFCQLNDEGQEKTLDYVDDLVQSGKYKKISTNCVDKKEVG